VSQKVDHVDVLVNNVGAFEGASFLDSDSEKKLVKMMNINFWTPFRVTYRFLNLLKLSKSRSLVVNVNSVAGLKALEGSSLYCISKFALNGLGQCMREEFKEIGIKVFNLFPGATLTKSWDGVAVEDGRLMKASDVASVIFNASELSDCSVVEDVVLRPFMGDL